MKKSKPLSNEMSGIHPQCVVLMSVIDDNTCAFCMYIKVIYERSSMWMYLDVLFYV